MYNIKGKDYPSVTTILEVIGKPRLMYWYGKIGTAAATKQKKQAAALGSKFHKYVLKESEGKGEKFIRILRKKGKFKGKLWNLVNQFLKFKDLYHFRSLKSEHLIYSKKHKYAGTLDALGYITINKKTYLVILDWKTSGKVYLEYRIQMSAYFYAYLEKNPETKLNGICCAAFTKSDADEVVGYEVKLITNKKKIRRYFEGFLAAKVIYDLQKKEG